MTDAHGREFEKRLRSYVPELLLGWPPEVDWQELNGTLVSADISGFTALSERLAALGREGAEELSTLICDCFDGMIDDAVGRGGDVITFGGDALLIWFDGHDHAVRAASAAIAMRRTIRHARRTGDGRRVHLAISIGIGSGITQFVQIEGEVPNLVVTGPCATATVRAESDADPGMILVTPETAALLPDAWVGDPHGSGMQLRRRAPNPPVPTSRAPWRRAPSTFVSLDRRQMLEAGLLDEHRQVAISFLVFGGTDTPIAEGSIGEIAARLRRLASLIADACRHNGTHLLATDVSTDGGKFVIISGAPRAIGDHEDRLLRTLRTVVDADPGLQLRAGVNRGSLFAGDIGSPVRRDYTTLGDSMNLAARLASKASPGQIVVSQTLLEWSSGDFDVTPLPPFQVKGKSQSIRASLLGTTRERRAQRLTVASPIVGRIDELERLRAVVADASAGRSRSAAIIGEPGIGKSRILIELATSSAPARAVLVRCTPLDIVTGRSAIIDALRPLLELPDDSPATLVMERLALLGGERFPKSVGLLPLLGVLVGAEADDTETSTLVPVELRAARTAQLMMQVIIALVSEHTVLLVDDEQHADDTTAATIELLTGAHADVPLCVLLVTMPDRAARLVDDDHTFEIGPLPPAETDTLVDALIGEAEVSTAMTRDIVSLSQGNPRFVVALAAAVLEGVDHLPADIDAAIQVRLDLLDPRDRNVLRAAAVVGTDVDEEILAELLGTGILTDGAQWKHLEEFLERSGRRSVRFRHDTHRRVVYDSLPFRQRRALHRQVLDAMTRAPGPVGRERAAVMARHAVGSADDVAIWHHARAAAAMSADVGLFGEAARLARWAWGARRAADVDELAETAEWISDVLQVAGDLAGADEALVRAVALSTSSIDRARRIRMRGDVAEQRGDYLATGRLFARAARELRSAGWATALREQAQLDCARSGFALRQGRPDAAWRLANLALGQAERVGDWSTAAHAALMVDNLITQISWSGVSVSRPDVRGLHERAGDLLGAARWMSNQAVDRYYEGAWDEALAMYRESAAQCVRFGHIVAEATATNNIAEIESDRGRYEEASSLLRTARRSWGAVGYGIGVALAQANLGRLATRTAAYEDAVPLLTDAIGRFQPLGVMSMVSDARLRLIENALIGRQPIEAEWWPQDSDLEEDVVVEIYRDRLRAVEALVDGDPDRAGRLASTAIDRARAAQLPFDLVLALRVRRAITGSVADDDEICALHSRLGIIVPPPVAPV